MRSCAAGWRSAPRSEKGLALLVRADRQVPLEDLGIIAEMAAGAGFTGGVQWAMEPGRANPQEGR